SAASKCLRMNHNLQTVGEAEELAQLLDDPNHNTTSRNLRCSCYICEAMKENLNCTNPNECLLRAKELMDTLPQKWDPRFMLPEDYEDSPTPVDEGIEFDRRVTTYGMIANTFHIFTEGKVCNHLPDLRLCGRAENVIQAATEGACLKDDTSGTSSGAGVCIEGGNNLQIAVKIPTSLQQSQQVGEVVAAKILAEK
ncbi:hypothetical protein IW262DRAFT_1248647, partial [Armillaria fumosa]